MQSDSFLEIEICLRFSALSSVKHFLFLSTLPPIKNQKLFIVIITIQTIWKVSGSGERSGKLLAWLGTCELFSLLTLRKYPVHSKCNKYLKWIQAIHQRAFSLHEFQIYNFSAIRG